MSDKSSNSTGGCILIVVIAVLIGYTQYQDYSEKAVVAAKEQRESAERAAAETKATVRAIDLAKNAHTLMKGRLFTARPPAETMTNDYQLRQMMSEMQGDLRVIGWQAKRHDADIFVVTYTYERHGQMRGYPFEVNVTAGVVRSIIGDSELEAKYGWHAEAGS